MSNYEKVRERLAKYRLQKTDNTTPTATEETLEVIQNSEQDNRKLTDCQHMNNLSSLGSHSEQTNNDRLSWAIFTLKCVLWCLLQALFVEIQFGVVFFVASCLFFIVFSLWGSKRKESELSAYSVFNKNFEKIEGTLTAEQFEREIRHGPVSVRH